MTARQTVTAETVGNPADVAVTAQPPGIGPAVPLTAAYCAERAASAIRRAETSPSRDEADQLLAAARQWRHLAAAMATNSAMNRPRDDRPHNDRR